MNMRYEIRTLSGEQVSHGGREYEQSLGHLLVATDDASEAKRIANAEGGRYQYGAAILDTVSGTVDCGWDEHGKPWIVPAEECPILWTA